MSRSAFDIIQELEDQEPPGFTQPRVQVRNYVAIWDGLLGFAWHVLPEHREEFVNRLRAMADHIEAAAAN